MPEEEITPQMRAVIALAQYSAALEACRQGVEAIRQIIHAGYDARPHWPFVKLLVGLAAVDSRTADEAVRAYEGRGMPSAVSAPKASAPKK